MSTEIDIIPANVWTDQGRTVLYGDEMVNLQQQLKLWTRTLNRGSSDSELFVELSPDCK